MRQVGLTTVQRWLSEPCEEGIKAYMQSGDCLYELRSLTGIAGKIGVSLLSPRNKGLPFAGSGAYTLQSPVYLYFGEGGLGGLEVDGIELAELGTTLARVNPGWAGGSKFNVAGTATGRVVSGAGTATAEVPEASMPHFG